MKTFNNRKEKMPTKVMYNIDAILSPRADPKKHIALGPTDKNRISRSRTKLSPSPTSKESSKF